MTGKPTVLLVTSSDDTKALVELMLESLERHRNTCPNVESFMGETLCCPSVQAAMDELGRRGSPEAADPALIVLDAFVRESNEVARPDGTAASRLMTWLEEHKPRIPVLISSPTSVERLDLKVLARRDVGLWSLTASGTPDHALRFAETADGLLPPYPPQQRRITVEVGLSSARYRIRDGHYEFNTDWKPYGEPATLRSLVNAFETFSPYGADRRLCDWQTQLGSYGRSLFELLLKDTLGPAVLKLISEVQISESTLSYDVDLRFDIDLSENESDAEPLFTLPFEVVNHDREPFSFLCARVPMARRLNLAKAHQRTPFEQVTLRELIQSRKRKLKILFVNANASGTIHLVDENGRTLKDPVRLDELRNAHEELEVLNELASTADALVDPPDVIEGTTRAGDVRRAGDIIAELRKKLIHGGYDIFHYSGHSVSPPKGGTFLIFPDGVNRVRAMSVHAVADWVSKGSCRLVVLSSCQGASLRTAIETMKAGAEAVLGFRWDVGDDGACVEYFRRFYAAYVAEGRSFSNAYFEACREVRLMDPGRPTWASAVAVVRD